MSKRILFCDIFRLEQIYAGISFPWAEMRECMDAAAAAAAAGLVTECITFTSAQLQNEPRGLVEKG